jgi:flagellar assembly factor FliW
MKVDTLRFGTLEFGEEQVIEFGEGILGFPRLRRFLHLGPEDTRPLEFLVPLEEPRLAFPMLDPFLLALDYALELAGPDREWLGLEEGGAALVYCVTTLATRPQEATINLLAPIVINPRTRRGRQVVLEGAPYPVAAPVFAGG